MKTAPDPYFPSHGDTRYGAEHYELKLDYKISTNRLDGVATIDVIAHAATSDIRLDLSGLKVSSVVVDGGRPKRFNHVGRVLTVTLPRPLEPGERATLVVSYAGKPAGVPGPFGSAGWEELTDGVLVASQPYGASSWFPCNDFAGDKATYRFEMTVDDDYRAICNGVETSRKQKSGRCTWVFEESHPMSPYLAVVHVGRYRARQLSDRVVFAAPPKVDAEGSAFARVPAMFDTLSRWYGDYPFADYTVVVTGDDLEIPLEAQGSASFGPNHVDDDWDAERLIVHELAHQWFGNSVTAGLGRDIWLHEGFACYTEWLWSEERGLDTADERARHHREHLDHTEWRLRDPGTAHMFDDGVYKRGALLLHALRGRLGDRHFFNMLRAWATDHAYGVVTTDDFVAHAQRFTVEPLDDFFTAWLDGTDVPDEA